jgi:threonine/homoserine/homoserine lactone efflux protein
MGYVVTVLPAFLLACVAVAALPGPSTALFVHRTVRDGRKAGLAAVAGNEIGVFGWAVVVIDGPYCAMIVLLASRARNWLSRAAIRRGLERVLGAALVGLGLDLAAAAR